jgi:hypothetical protein
MPIRTKLPPPRVWTAFVLCYAAANAVVIFALAFPVFAAGSALWLGSRDPADRRS